MFRERLDNQEITSALLMVTLFTTGIRQGVMPATDIQTFNTTLINSVTMLTNANRDLRRRISGIVDDRETLTVAQDTLRTLLEQAAAQDADQVDIENPTVSGN